MRQGPRVFDEIAFARRLRTSAIRFTGRERMSEENFWSRKTVRPSLQAKLKPIAAGDAIAGPIVEVFVCNNGFDVCKVSVSCGVGAG